MRVVQASTADHALFIGMQLLKAEGVRRSSRNGEVMVMREPVTTVYTNPLQRVLFHPARDANPFFHLYEAMWMLGGRRRVAPLTHFVKRMASFSDDGHTLTGAYGFRWRKWFGSEYPIDQLSVVAARLRDDPDDRRCVVAMWDGGFDLTNQGRDVPCNTHIYFTRNVGGELDMTVSCRSNDIIWGAYGANLVHFSFLLEYMAALIGCQVGTYRQISNNFHAYTDVFDRLYDAVDTFCPYIPVVYPDIAPLFRTNETLFHGDLELFLNGKGPQSSYDEPFFQTTAMPMMQMHSAFRDKRREEVERWSSLIVGEDWRLACTAWCERRMAKW